MLREQEILPALHLVWDVFVESVAPAYTPEGVAKFQQYIKYDHIAPMYKSGELVCFGAFDDGGQLCGVIALEAPGTENTAQGTYSMDVLLRLFFVKKEMQRKGIGRMLYQTAYNYSVNSFRAKKLVVQAAPGAVECFLHLGMHQTADAQMVDGVRFVPMEIYVVAGLVRPAGKKSKAPWIALGIGLVVLLALIIFGSYQIGKMVKNEMQKQEQESEYSDDLFDFFDSDDGDDDFYNYFDYGDDYNSSGDSGESGDTTITEDGNDDDETPAGLDAVPAHIEENLSYELGEDAYTFSDDSKSTSVINFEVNYPTVTGLADESVEEKVNEALKDTAMDTVDKIYNNPSDEIKERVLAADQPVLVSYVEYKVCYASENLLSVAYSDYSYEGDTNHYKQYLRTCNISLKDGTVYEVKDIINIDDDFVKDWLSIMRSEVDNEKFLSELTKDDMKKTLEGDSLDGVYVVNFFLDEDGIEIGFDLNYASDDENNLGYVWVTAPFTYNEIEKYQKDVEFWSFK
jgi:predicted GNAT family N-acyltransferase